MIKTFNIRTGYHLHLEGTYHELYDGPSFAGYVVVTDDGKTQRYFGKINSLDLYRKDADGNAQMVGTIRYISADGNIFPSEDQVKSGRYYPVESSIEDIREYIKQALV